MDLLVVLVTSNEGRGLEDADARSEDAGFFLVDFPLGGFIARG